MPKLPDLVARIRLDTSALDRATNQVKAQTSGISKSFSRIGIAARLGMAGATLALAKFGKDAIAAASESRKVGAQTGAVLKATGGAAKVNAKHIGDLAKRLQKLSGVQDEAIQSGQNMLLTFLNVRNETGRGNAIFDRATQAMLDMSVALGIDAKSAAIQLGKALNDPARGAAALSRSGSLAKDDLQKLKEMAASGTPILEQQKFILEALAKQYGGAAQAAGDARTPMEKLRLVFDDLNEAIGERLLVALDNLEAWWQRNGPFITEWARLLAERFRSIGEAISGFAEAVYGVLLTINSVFEHMAKAANAAAKAVGNLAKKIASIPGVGPLQAIPKLIGKIPGFARGGTVPGPIGAPQLAVVHGGERVIPAGRAGGGDTIINMRNGPTADEIVRAIAWHGRRTG